MFAPFKKWHVVCWMGPQATACVDVLSEVVTKASLREGGYLQNKSGVRRAGWSRLVVSRRGNDTFWEELPYINEV